MLIHSFQLPAMPLENPPDFTILETQDLGNPLEVDDFHFITSVQMLKGVTSRILPLIVAMDSDYVVVTVPNHLYRLDGGLKIVGDLTAEFIPLALSLDEAGRSYLIVQSQNKTMLWVVTPSGEQLLSVEIQTVLPTIHLPPPVIGYDHRSLVLGSS